MLPATNGEKGDDDICGCASGDDIDAGAKGDAFAFRFCCDFATGAPKIPLVFATEPPFPNVLLVLAGADDGAPPNGELLFVVVVLAFAPPLPPPNVDPNVDPLPPPKVVVVIVAVVVPTFPNGLLLLVFCAFDAPCPPAVVPKPPPPPPNGDDGTKVVPVLPKAENACCCC